MFHKYTQTDPNDMRGMVRYAVRNSDTGVETIYTTTLVPDEDMTELTQAEFDMVVEATGPWKSYREILCEKIDQLADQVRESHKDAGSNIDIEYYQVQTAIKEWQAAGSDMQDVPVEVSSWATAQNQSIEWAVTSILAQVDTYANLIRAVRSTRLAGKASVMTLEPSLVQEAYDSTISQLESYMGS